MGIAGRNDAAQGPVASGTLEVHALGWGFEANVGEMKSQLEKDGMERKVHVTLNDVARFDRRHRCTHYERADSGYASIWYVGEGHDGDCFVGCQEFFDSTKTPDIKAALDVAVDTEKFALELTSEPFPLRGYGRIAVKVMDVCGNEPTVVREI